MKLVVQRVKKASVVINNNIYSLISQGLLVFIGIHVDDTKTNAQYLVKKLIQLRIFEDNNNKMNLSLKDLNLEIMIISQFTLYGNCSRGNRPNFSCAANPTLAEELYNYFIKEIQSCNINFKTGKFGEMMQVHLINDGPATFVLKS